MLFVLAALAAPPPVVAQAPPPDGPWDTFSTAHFRVTYPPRLEGMARAAAGVAERTHAMLREELARAPDGPIDLVVSDHTDYSNGFAQLFPSNRIVVFARPAAGGDFFARDWLELVVAHEVVHAFHQDESGLVGNVARAVFGQIPSFWPVFPVVASPAWSTEGLATHYESRLTGAGRVRSSFHDMIIRTAALGGGIPDLDDVSAPNPVWPAGNRSYIYGSRLMRYIADAYGAAGHRAIVEATGGSVWPTFFRFDHVARDAVGKPFDVLYEEWRGAATAAADRVQRRVRAAGVTETRPVAGRGPYAVAPRVSPDGRRLAFAASDWRSDPATRILDLETGEVRAVQRRNQFGQLLAPPSWLPDGSGVVVSQLEYQGPYRIYSDLWRVGVDGTERRLTDGLRLDQPDVAADGRVAAVQTHDGGRRLVVHRPATGETRVVADAGPGETFDRPRWSPDGRWIAASRHAAYRTDLVLVDPVSGGITAVTDDTALDGAPAWSPDGRWLLWWSDRTGIPNILAVAMADGRPDGPVRQVTNVVTGVIDPEVAPDGETLYLAAYHEDGWRIEAVAFEPASWPEAPPSTDRFGPALLPRPDSAAVPAAEASRYSPLPTLRPYAWIPTWEEVGSGDDALRFLGASVGGQDVLRRHQWGLQLAGDLDTGRFRGTGSWIYRGLGNPELFAVADRAWSGAGSIDLGDGTSEPVFLRDDELVIGAVLRRRRWRSGASVQVAGELQRQTFEARDLSDDELARLGRAFRAPPTLAGLSVTPRFATARRHPFSISPEDGIDVSVGGGRWWDVSAGGRAYDEVSARTAGYLGAPVWGFADHVFALRVAGLARAGDHPPLRSIGGVGDAGVSLAGGDRSRFPVRGFDSGVRFGTRAWTANAEWRFPVLLRHAPGGVLGFSLVSLSGAAFADLGNAWCTEAQRSRPQLRGCPGAGVDPVASAGLELKVDFGIFHNSLARLAVGVAQPLQGPGNGPVFYVGTAF